MDQLDWPQIRDALTAAIRDALPLQIRRAAGDRIAGVGLHIDGYYGSAGLYLLPESAARALAPEGADYLGDWPISTDWNQSEDHAQAFMVHWRPWDQWIYNHLGDFDDEATMARGRELLRAGCEAVLADAQDRESGGFGHDRAHAAGGAQHGTVLPCLTGNLVWALVVLGMADDPRVHRGVDWLTTYQRFDTDGPAPSGWPYLREPCWGRHTCHMGVVKALKALAVLPAPSRTPAVERRIADGCEYLLRHHVHKRW